MRKFRALEDRFLPPLQREVKADEVFEVDDSGPLAQWVAGLGDQPYFEDITPAKRPEKKD